MHRYRTRLVAKRKQSRSSKEAAPADPRPADPNPTQAGPSQLVGPAPALGRTNLQQRKGLIRMLPNPSGEMRIDDGFTQSVESEFHAYSTLSPEGEAQLAQYGDIDLRLLDFWEVRRRCFITNKTLTIVSHRTSVASIRRCTLWHSTICRFKRRRFHANVSSLRAG